MYRNSNFRSAIVLLALSLLVSKNTEAQEKWTCYNNQDQILMDEHPTMGVFEYQDNSLWILTKKGINIFDGEKWEKIDDTNELIQKRISTYLVDSQNRVWIGTEGPEIFDGWGTARLYNGGLAMYDGDEWTRIPKKDIDISAPHVNIIYETSEGDIWVAWAARGEGNFSFLDPGGLVQYKSGKWINHSENLPCGDCKSVRGIHEDDQGRIWFWSTKNLFNYENGEFILVTKDDGYNQKGLNRAVFVDNKKRLWFGGGISVAMFNGQDWRTFNKKDGYPSNKTNTVYEFHEFDNDIIALTSVMGIFVYDGKNDTWDRIKYDNNAVSFKQKYHSYKDQDGALWISYNKNFGKFDGKSWTQEKRELEGRFFVDDEARIWAPTQKGLAVKEGGQWILRNEVKDAWGIVLDNKKGVWVLSNNGGVLRHMDKSWSHYTDENELPSNKVSMAFVANDGTIWIGTDKGICSCKYQ